MYKKRLQAPRLITEVNPQKGYNTANKDNEKCNSKRDSIHNQCMLAWLIRAGFISHYRQTACPSTTEGQNTSKSTTNIAGYKNQTYRYYY